MSVTLTSAVPVYAGPPSIVTTIIAPNQGAGFFIGIGDVAGLQAALDTKLEDVLGPLAPLGANITTTGAELNFLTGVTSSVQTQLDGKVDLTGDTMTGSLIMGTGQFLADLGTVSVPGFAFDGDGDTGFWRPANNVLGIVTGGVEALRITSAGLLESQIASYETLVTADNDIPNKKYVDDQIALITGGPFLELAGGVMTGDIDLNGNLLILDINGDSSIGASSNDVILMTLGGSSAFQFDATCLDVFTKTIKNVVDPVNAQEAATKNYVDTEIVGLNLGATPGPYLPLSGADAMTGALDMGTNLINNVVNPVNPQDAATMDYVDTEIVALGLTATGPFLRLSGADTMLGGIQMGGFGISNLLDPVNPQDAVTLNYADNNYLSTTGAVGPLGGTIDMGGFRITNVGNPVAAQDAATKSYVDTNFLDLLGTSAMQGAIDMNGFGISNLLAATANDEAVNLGQGNTLWLRRDGTTDMTGGLDMGGFAISNVLAATANDEAVNLGQADARYLDLLGTSAMQAALNMGSFQINNLADPTLAQDAATKDYVDTELAGLNLSSTFVNVTGDTMTGDLTLGAGAQHLADTGLLAAPAYSFSSNTDTGMWFDGVSIRIGIDSSNALTIAPSGGANEIDVHGRTVTGVADPVADDDAVTKGYLDSLATIRVLGFVSGVNLMTAATTAVYTVPAGKMHIITQILVRPDTYTPGAAPTNPDVSVGLTGSFNQIINNNTVLDWGGTAGAADQIVYLQPKDGSPTPNPGEIVRFQVDTAAGGTFSALNATVYILGIEL